MLIYSRCLLVAFATFAIFTLGACSSIYHHAGSDMTVGLGPLLATRIADARNNAAAAADAISSPHARQCPDTAEPYSWDFSKSVASVHDVVKRLEIQDDPVNDVLAAFDRADVDLAAAVDPDQTAPSTHALATAADSLNLAIAKANAYLKTGPTSTRPVAALR